ncbi:MAG TPA: ribonuclease HII [Candidatus Saccharimonadales bacterium]
MIIGIDEVGRGSLAGPLVIGAVAIAPDAVKGLKDSKLLTAKRRNEFARLIRLYASWIGIGWVSAKMIDRIGLGAALRLAAERAVADANGEHEIIIDGTIKLLNRPNVSVLAKADQLIPAVSAASIVAKVARDTYMQTVDAVFPNYGFKSHVGYATPYHRAMLKAYGPSPLHRGCFAPVKEQLGGAAVLTERPLTSGAWAEAIAADYLETHGFTVIERNWKTKFCEIDVVAKKANKLYFTEVKYRKNMGAGAGLEHITPAKRRQMGFAAQSWVHAHHFTGNYSLAALEVSGPQYKVTAFLSDIGEAMVRRAQTRQFG